MPYLMFVVVSLLAFVYFYFKKRDVDIYLIAATSGFLFFSAAYTGRISGPRGYPPLAPPAILYYSFSLYLIAIVAAASLKDTCHKYRNQPNRPMPSTNTRVAVVLLTMWGLSAVDLIARYPDHVFSGCKTNLMTAAGARHTLALSLSMLAATCIVTSRMPGRLVATACILGFSLLAGDRTTTALTLIACVLIYGKSLQPIALLRKRPLLLPVAAVALVTAGAALKWGYSAYRDGGVFAVREVFSTRSPFEIVRDGAEFLTTQYIFADIVNCSFETDGGHIFRSPLSVLPIPRYLYTTGSDEFNGLFQPALYGDVKWGMAFNPFAEFYSAGGGLGVVAFVAVMLLALFLIDRFMCSRRHARWTPLVAIVGALVAFYIHRNSVAVTFAMIRNVLWPYIAVLVLSRLVFVTNAGGKCEDRHRLGRTPRFRFPLPETSCNEWRA